MFITIGAFNLSRPKMTEEGPVQAEKKTAEIYDPRKASDRVVDTERNMIALRALKDIFPNTGNDSINIVRQMNIF